MGKTIVGLFLILASSFSQATCYGTGAFRTCTDSSGNNYNIQQYGNSTNMQGYNAATGSNWTQNSQTFGNTTQIQGNSNGRNWSETIQSSPGMTTYSGTNSQGQNFYKICTVAGCN